MSFFKNESPPKLQCSLKAFVIYSKKYLITSVCLMC